MFVTIMRTVRISDLRRGHLRAGFVPWLQVGFFPRSESAGCTIVTIEPPSPDRLSAGPLYMCAPRALGFVPFRVLVFMPYRAIIVFRPTLPRTALFLVPAEVSANHRSVHDSKNTWFPPPQSQRSALFLFNELQVRSRMFSRWQLLCLICMFGPDGDGAGGRQGRRFPTVLACDSASDRESQLN